MKITEAQVFVTDLQKAEAFYSETLQFPLKSKDKNWLLYEPGLEFVVMAGAIEQKLSAPYGNRADSVVCLDVTNIEEVVRDLKKKEVQIICDIQVVPQGKFASFSDPDGNVFELVEKPISVRILPYKTGWPNQFELLKQKLSDVLQGLYISIDHIGSTAVPGLASKDRIDVQITVEELTEEFKVKLDSSLASGGFSPSKWNEDHRPPEDLNPDNEWKKLYLSGTHPDLSFRANVHIRAEGRANQKYPLLFRDYLRANREAAVGYQKAKEELARFHGQRSLAYTELKDPICDLIMVGARKWARETGWNLKLQQIQQPRFETKRLVLEAYQDSDASDVFEYASRPEVTKFLLWEPHKTLEDSQRFLEWVRSSTSASRGKLFFVFAIRLKETSRVVGSIDFKNPQPWVGQIDYALHVDQWGKGLMAEAACAIRDWAFDSFEELVRIQSYCDPENSGSRRVMEKTGLTFEGIRKKSFKSKGRIIDLAHYAFVRNL